MRRITDKSLLTTQDFASDTNSSALDLEWHEGCQLWAYVNATQPVATSYEEADVNVANDTITETAHGYATGLEVVESTTGTLPAPLAVLTDYYVIRVDANTYKLATSKANAVAGTAINLTDDGTGTHTTTPNALSGGSASIQVSRDDVTYVEINGTSVAITASGNLVWNVDKQYARYIRVSFLITDGQLNASVFAVGKSEFMNA